MRLDAIAVNVIQAPKLELQIMRYELSDYEWTAIKPMLPNKPRVVRRVDQVATCRCSLPVLLPHGRIRKAGNMNDLVLSGLKVQRAYAMRGVAPGTWHHPVDERRGRWSTPAAGLLALIPWTIDLRVALFAPLSSAISFKADASSAQAPMLCRSAYTIH